MNYTTQQLFTAACCGDIPTLRDYYQNGGKPNRRYNRFRKNHSLIAGAIRNAETPTVFFLLANGETVEEYEKAELINWLDKHDRLSNNELRLEIGMGLTI